MNSSVGDLLHDARRSRHGLRTRVPGASQAVRQQPESRGPELEKLGPSFPAAYEHVHGNVEHKLNLSPMFPALSPGSRNRATATRTTEGPR